MCDRTTKRDLRLAVNEDYGFCGIVLGCLGGLARFFCLCEGVCTLYLGSYSSSQTKSTKRGCAKCCEPDVAEPASVDVQIQRC